MGGFRLSRTLASCLIAGLLTGLGWLVLVPAAQAQGVATALALAMSPSTVQVGGAAITATVTATAAGVPVAGEMITVSSSDPSMATQTATDNMNGTYTATFSSSKKAGAVTFTALDSNGVSSSPQTITQTPGSAATMSLGLSRSSVPVGGTPVTATVTVDDASGNGVSGENITVSGSPGIPAQTATDDGNGVYTATVDSTGVAGPVTIAATDNSTPGVVPNPATQTLTQTVASPANITLSLSPQTILANGSSTSVATATITDAFGNPAPGQTVVISSSDPGERVSPTPATDNGNGTYTATITSSAAPGSATIRAADGALGSPPQTLKQVALTSTTTLVLSPASVVTNQGVTLIATINPEAGALADGTMGFFAGPFALPGCTAIPVSSSTPVAACPAAFGAASSPVPLLAVFSPSLASNVAGSTAAASLPVAKASTSTSVVPSTFTPAVGARETFTASVVPSPSGPTVPSGTVEFEQGGKPIGSCKNVAVSSASTASCTVKYHTPGAHRITAAYSGDGNFTGSASGGQTIRVGAQGTLTPTMQWIFVYNPRFTTVATLQVNGVAVGANVLVMCKGGGCPFTRHMTTLHRGFRCTRSGRHKCGSPGPVNVGANFRSHHLAVGTKITVEIRRAGYVGKFYSFTIRSGRGPLIRISCLAPGLTKPGVACSL